MLEIVTQYVQSWLPTLAITIVTLLFLWRRSLKKPKGYPPGYTGMPIFGVVPFVNRKHPAEDFRRWGTKVGPVMSLRMGLEDWVIVNDYEIINKFLIDHGKVTSGRPNLRLLNDTYKGYGFGFQDYTETFKILKKFSAISFQKYGVANKSIEDKINIEVDDMAKHLLKDAGKPVNPMFMLSCGAANIIGGIMLGSRFEYEDKMLIRLLELMHKSINNEEDGKYIAMMNFFYYLRYIPPFYGAYHRLQERLRERKQHFKNFVEEHVRTFDKNNIRDMIDQFIEKQAQNVGNPSFAQVQIVQSITGLLDGGTDTTANTLRWAILFLLENPGLQDKIYGEIKEVMGETLPSMDHRDDMPITCSFIDECYRIRPVFPISMLHKASETFEACGYTIPKGTTIIPNLWGIHHDPKHFADPFTFKYDRFLDPKTGKFERSKFILPFGFGPRYCLGEKLAEREVFMFLTGILQRLKVSYDHSKPLPSSKVGLFGGAIYSPYPYTCIFEERE